MNYLKRPRDTIGEDRIRRLGNFVQVCSTIFDFGSSDRIVSDLQFLHSLSLCQLLNHQYGVAVVLKLHTLLTKEMDGQVIKALE